MATSRGGLPKPVLNSPAQQEAASEPCSSSNSTQMDNLISKSSFPDDLEKNKSSVRDEEQRKRLQKLRKEIDYLKSTAWLYE